MNGLAFFRAGAVVLILFGLAHLAGHLSSKDAPPQNEQERQLKELMYGYKTNLMGAMRSQGEIVDGFSLAISIFTIGAGAVALVTARSRDPHLLSSIALVQCAWIGISAGISLRYWFAAPTTFLVLSFLCFLVAMVRLKGAASARIV